MKLNPSPFKETPEEAGSLILERFVPYRLSVLSNTVSRAIARIYAERFDLTIPEWRVMAQVGRHGRLTASDIIGLTAMDKVRVSRAVARLTAAGRVEATSDAADRRRQVLALTAAGRRIYREIVPLALEREARLLDALEPKECQALDRLLAKLQARASTLAPHGEGELAEPD
ncbi:MAG: winged helix-turn-helix transcriptional regulator [Alphaproteobacteria bacterium]|nr:winged helix-turn-helix transcriptional regulator [Alphaproteobacteria bacterium]